MHKLLGTAAIVAAMTLMATPAMAQNINTSGDAQQRARLDVGFTPDPHEAQVTAGGPISASNVNESCVGNVGRRASFTLRYRAGEAPLIINATSEVDTTLMVRAPDGSWHCNDDTNGLDPQVRFNDPANGRYQIWVGRWGDTTETAAATVRITEIEGGPSGELPDFSLEPAYGAIDLTAGFTPDPHTVAVAAGGELDAGNIGVPGCVGAIARAPDFRLNWTAGDNGLPLIISAASAGDVTLVINDAQGNWVCNDDREGSLNPLVSFETPVSGQYDIWVGTFSEGELQDSTLYISEVTAPEPDAAP